MKRTFLVLALLLLPTTVLARSKFEYLAYVNTGPSGYHCVKTKAGIGWEAYGLDKMATKMEVDKPTSKLSVLDIYDKLGSYGWEMVSLTIDGGTTTTLFKRKLEEKR